MKKNRTLAQVKNSKWLNYAAASAAGAAVLTATAANAELTCIDLGVEIADPNPNDFGDIVEFGPFNIGPATYFTMHQDIGGIQQDIGLMYMVGTGMSFAGSSAQSAGSTFFFPSNIPYGQGISSRAFQIGSGDRADMAWGAAPGYGSNFLDAGTGYVGFRFDAGGGTQYGFIEFDMSGAPENSGTLVSIVYGDVGDDVLAGVKSTVPEPGALGLLALGGTAMLTWRRRRNVA